MFKHQIFSYVWERLSTKFMAHIYSPNNFRVPNMTPQLHVYVTKSHAVFTQPAFKLQSQIDPWDAQIKM